MAFWDKLKFWRRSNRYCDFVCAVTDEPCVHLASFTDGTSRRCGSHAIFGGWHI